MSAFESREYCKNSGDCLDIDLIGSTPVHSKLRFLCPIHGVYEQEIRRHHMGCKYCSHSKISEVHNGEIHNRYSFPQWFIDELEYEQDKRRAVSNNMKSGEKVYFHCDEHGPYLQEVSCHIRKSSGTPKNKCPLCAEKKRHRCRSKKEEEAYQYLISIYDGEVIPNFRGLAKLRGRYMELDLYCPSLGIAFEIDGGPYHTENCTYDYYYNEIKSKDRSLYCWYGYHDYKDSEFLKYGVRIIHIGDYDYYKKVIREEIHKLCIN